MDAGHEIHTMCGRCEEGVAEGESGVVTADVNDVSRLACRAAAASISSCFKTLPSIGSMYSCVQPKRMKNDMLKREK